MYRKALDYLQSWKSQKTRKPLVLRGARQVGKSFLSHELAKSSFQNWVEINFEKQPEISELFQKKTPKAILPQLELKFETRIQPGKTLLFLDEIQAAPLVFASLRYFYEEMPELHVIAAGSLLDFMLEDHSFSMPVGRIEYCHLGPMTFEEFLIATERTQKETYLASYSMDKVMSPLIHNELMLALKEFMVVGGMPESILSFKQTGSFLECQKVKASLLATYQDDFNKYGKRVNTDHLRSVFQKIPQLVGGKFKATQVSRDEQAATIGKALHLLTLAKVADKIYHTDANGIPLRAERDERKFKPLFLDVGLMCQSCGLNSLDFEKAEDILLVNSGSICEQFIGQHLRSQKPFFEEPEIFYWAREKPQSSAEVDYVLSFGQNIIPIEVKAGKSNILKSIHTFLHKKKRNLAIRFNSEIPTLTKEQATLPTGEKISYSLLSLPLYMVGQLERLLKENTNALT